MKTETLLLIAGAVGIGYLLSKKKAAETTAAQQQLVATPRIAQITEPDDVLVQIPDVQYVPVPAWGPSWGSYRGGRRGGGHHHGHHGMHGFHGRRR